MLLDQHISVITSYMISTVSFNSTLFTVTQLFHSIIFYYDILEHLISALKQILRQNNRKQHCKIHQPMDIAMVVSMETLAKEKFMAKIWRTNMI